jgi:hypothetical protein
MSKLIPVVLLSFCFAGVGRADDVKIKVAEAQIAEIDKAVQVYYIQNGEYPKELKELEKGDRPFVKPGSLIDPWKNPYKYDAAGPKNDNMKPDIWTVTPDKKTIGNWPEKK